MQTARERAQIIVRSMPLNLLDHLIEELLSDAIEQALKEVAEDQRRIIAEALAAEASCEEGTIHGSRAEYIAMNTRVVL